MIKLTVTLNDGTKHDVEKGFISFNDGVSITFIIRHSNKNITVETKDILCIGFRSDDGE